MTEAELCMTSEVVTVQHLLSKHVGAADVIKVFADISRVLKPEIL